MSNQKQAGIQPYTLRINSAVAFSGLSRAKLYRCLNDGKLESIKVGKRRLILREALERYLAGHAVGTTQVQS